VGDEQEDGHSINQGSHNDGKYQAIGHLLKALDKGLEGLWTQTHFHVSAFQLVEQAAQLLWEFYSKSGCINASSADLWDPVAWCIASQQESLRKRGQQTGQLEGGIEHASQALVHQEHFEEERQVGRQLQMVASYDGERLCEEWPQGDLTKRTPKILSEPLMEVATQGAPIDTALRAA
jgi:hypothetical protein